MSLLTIEPALRWTGKTFLSGLRNGSLVQIKTLWLSESVMLLSTMVPHIGGTCLQSLFLCCCAMLLATLVLLLVLWLLHHRNAVRIGTTIFSLLLVLVATLILLLIVNLL